MANPNIKPHPEGLKRGNTINVGRKKLEVRARYLAAADNEWLRGIARGLKVVEDKPGDKSTKRYPTFEERRWAVDQCLKFGLGTENTQKIDLANLSNEQLISILEENAGGGSEA